MSRTPEGGQGEWGKETHWRGIKEVSSWRDEERGRSQRRRQCLDGGTGLCDGCTPTGQVHSGRQWALGCTCLGSVSYGITIGKSLVDGWNECTKPSGIWVLSGNRSELTTQGWMGSVGGVRRERRQKCRGKTPSHGKDNHVFPFLKQWFDNLKAKTPFPPQPTPFLTLKRRHHGAGIRFAFFVLIMSKVVKQMSRTGKINICYLLVWERSALTLCVPSFYQKHLQQ